jgi:hypothetical protein
MTETTKYYTGDQKVSVHLRITVHHQVHRDFLITLNIIRKGKIQRRHGG